MLDFKQLMDNIILESLHPELKAIAASSSTRSSKQTAIANKIKDLTSRGEETGIEGNMPKGSSRAYLKHKEEFDTTVDGKPAKLKTGTKVAIRAVLDAHHNKEDYDGLSLGQLQNKAEGGDWIVNEHHRILRPTEDGKGFETNHDGIFPPLIDHDHENHHWSHVGHARDIKAPEFKTLTKTETHPKGISHTEFVDALERFHNRNNGRHWAGSGDNHLDHIEDHPLVRKFIDYHGNFAAPPHDYRQIKNMGVFEHPDGSKHIVARDHGFDNEVQRAYQDSRKKKYARGY